MRRDFQLRYNDMLASTYLHTLQKRLRRNYPQRFDQQLVNLIETCKEEKAVECALGRL